ncbi:hypothetical protein HDU97_001226 [Phlyctochytrium planicorne]|nr:hypothetical protein HDU97_001226 [Phlyctochytrium planicorne]
MKFTATILFAATVFTSVHARFAQEQLAKLGEKIQAAGCGGVASKFSGQEISTLLAAADPCNKLTTADAVVAAVKADAACTNKAKAIEAAMDLVVAEKNFNPFNGDKDSICTKAGLPASPELAGLLQLVDPRTVAPNNKDAALAAKAAAFNAKVASTLAAAKAAGKGPGSGGKSLADVSAAAGFDAIQNFAGKAALAAEPAVDAAAEEEEPAVEAEEPAADAEVEVAADAEAEPAADAEVEVAADAEAEVAADAEAEVAADAGAAGDNVAAIKDLVQKAVDLLGDL